MICNSEGRRLARVGKDKKKLAALQEAERAVTRLVQVELLDNHFSALCCLVMDLGANTFRRSRMLRLINEGDFFMAAKEFDTFRMREEKPYRQRRRRAEQALFLKPSLVVHKRGRDEVRAEGTP